MEMENNNIRRDAKLIPQKRKNSTKQVNATAAYRKDSGGINPQAENLDPIGNSVESTSTTDVFGRFFDKREYCLDALEYPRDGDDPGLVLIFNQEHFQGSNETREGSEKDVQDIITCFGRLGFNIRKNHIFKDCSEKELFQKVDEVLNSDLSQINSVLVFILSHGGNCNLIHTSSNGFKLEDLLSKFANCEALRGKPKMFVVQACKGDERTVISTEGGNKQIVPLSTFSEIYPDIIIIYSTMEGKYAFRDIEKGTWLIQEICKNFTAYGRRDDILTLSTRVTKCICTNYYLQNLGDVEKQIPVVVSTLSKKFYLNRNKDRHFVIKSSETLNGILNQLKVISGKME
ncbi:caspase-3-like [Coccinella septempunctata]|uniref:caspase-3-like n=1 Tax=Coccinella septempunctata TaxID=41139 RepID=UPI001D068FDA|nr:caspase-3-like [Coccinella septempunctata]